MKVTKFDKPTLRALRPLLEKALAEVAEGVEFELGAIRFDPNSFRVTLEAKTQAGAAQEEAIDEQMLASAMTSFGLTRKVSACGRKLTGYNPRRPKYPFSFEGPQGGRYKCSPEQAKFYFA